MRLEKKEIREIVKTSLAEDISGGDITSDIIQFKEGQGPVTGKIIAKEKGVVCGTEIVEMVFKEISPDTDTNIVFSDGSKIAPGDMVIEVKGKPEDILAGERTALNFLSHLSGISTLTSKFVEKVKSKNPGCAILDTRKTLPGLRIIEKYAVITGGGENHRHNLSEHILIKENHLFLSKEGITKTVENARKKTAKNMFIELEVENLQQLKEALKTDADLIMLDNFSLENISEARNLIKLLKPETKLEVSGGVTLESAGKIAALGVERISIGSLTDSAPALDFSLLIKK